MDVVCLSTCQPLWGIGRQEIATSHSSPPTVRGRETASAALAIIWRTKIFRGASSPEEREEFTRFDDVDENGEWQHCNTLYSYPFRKVARPDRGFRMMDFLIWCSLADRLDLDSGEIFRVLDTKVPSPRNRRFSGIFRASSMCRSRRSTVGEGSSR